MSVFPDTLMKLCISEIGKIREVMAQLTDK